MQTVKTQAELRAIVKTWRTEGRSVAFVPTMGNLHAGHLKLVEAAKVWAERTVVSIFVNPSQFGPGEDYENYPRTEAEDRQKLADAGVDALFLPDVAEMYGENIKTVITVQALAGLHCGRFRPGHFDGVATVVGKLFNLVQPDAAFFGEKDYQQLTIIRAMVRDLNIPVVIKAVATVRESDGLAMSSRNSYLTPEQRQIAPKLYQCLCQARAGLQAGQQSYASIEQEATANLQKTGFQVDYFTICRTSDLLPAGPDDRDIIILAAAKLGNTRLIDNISAL